MTDISSYFESLNSYFESLNSYFQSLNSYFETVADTKGVIHSGKENFPFGKRKNIEETNKV